jgi:hypothetical protein
MKLLLNLIACVTFLYFAYRLLVVCGVKSFLAQYKELRKVRKETIIEARQIKKETEIEKEPEIEEGL